MNKLSASYIILKCNLHFTILMLCFLKAHRKTSIQNYVHFYMIIFGSTMLSYTNDIFLYTSEMHFITLIVRLKNLIMYNINL